MNDQPKAIDGASAAPDALLKVTAAAERLCISERKLWSLTAKKAIPVVRFGRSVRYCPEALARIIVRRGPTARTLALRVPRRGSDGHRKLDGRGLRGRTDNTA